MLFGYGIYQQDMYKEKVCDSLPRFSGRGLWFWVCNSYSKQYL